MLFAIYVPSFLPDDRLWIAKRILRQDFEIRGSSFIFLTKSIFLKSKKLSEFLWTLEILLILTATIQFIDQETLRSENINRFRLPSKEGMEALFQDPYHVSKSLSIPYIFLLIVCEADLEILMLSVSFSVVMLKKGC